MIRSLLLIFLVVIGSSSWAQAPKQKSGPTQDAAQASAMPAEASGDPQSTSATYGDWLLVCRRLGDAQQHVCQVTQQIQVQGQPGPIAQLVISRNDSTRGLHLVLVLPNNVTLVAEPTVAHGETGGKELKLAWARCIPGGCTADAVLGDDVVKRWRNTAERGHVAFKDGLGRDLAIPISFRGLAPALDALARK